MLNCFGLLVWELRIENLALMGEKAVFYLNVHFYMSGHFYLCSVVLYCILARALKGVSNLLKESPGTEISGFLDFWKLNFNSG